MSNYRLISRELEQRVGDLLARVKRAQAAPHAGEQSRAEPQEISAPHHDPSSPRRRRRPAR